MPATRKKQTSAVFARRKQRIITVPMGHIKVSGHIHDARDKSSIMKEESVVFASSGPKICIMHYPTADTLLSETMVPPP